MDGSAADRRKGGARTDGGKGGGRTGGRHFFKIWLADWPAHHIFGSPIYFGCIFIDSVCLLMYFPYYGWYFPYREADRGAGRGAGGLIARLTVLTRWTYRRSLENGPGWNLKFKQIVNQSLQTHLRKHLETSCPTCSSPRLWLPNVAEDVAKILQKFNANKTTTQDTELLTPTFS